MQFVFFDVEALGPPGAGDLFALGAVRFDPPAPAKRVARGK